MIFSCAFAQNKVLPLDECSKANYCLNIRYTTIVDIDAPGLDQSPGCTFRCCKSTGYNQIYDGQSLTFKARSRHLSRWHFCKDIQHITGTQVGDLATE